MLTTILMVLLLGLALLVAAGYALIRSRDMQYWLPAYFASRQERRTRGSKSGEVTTVYVCVADHYEPFFGGRVTPQQAAARVDEWITTYPQIASKHRDSSGRAPQHTFFYPLEEYDRATLDKLAALSRQGFGDVEVHYHHDNDTAEGLSRALRDFTQTLHHQHGLLRIEPGTKDIAYCFIHGNWALDNSRPDGRWCGVNDEITVLAQTGCRVDYTMPSAPSDTQTRKINSIYFARGKPGQCKSHDTGRDLKVGEWGQSPELLMVQGPLGLNWKSRKLGLIPRIENGEISADARPTVDRVRLWLKLSPRIRGAEDHIFVKLHTHGAVDAATKSLLGGDFDRMWTALEAQVRDRPGYRLRYVTAWEMYSIIKAIAAGARESATPAVRTAHG